MHNKLELDVDIQRKILRIEYAIESIEKRLTYGDKKLEDYNQSIGSLDKTLSNFSKDLTNLFDGLRKIEERLEFYDKKPAKLTEAIKISIFTSIAIALITSILALVLK